MAKLRKILPVSRIVVEVAAFDIQKIRNPDIQGAEYQQGEQMGFWNVREYVLSRDRHTCRKCRGKSGDEVLNVHHIESRKTGGDAPNNLLTLCETCHKAYHKGEITLKGVTRGKSFRESAFMNLTRGWIYRKLRDTYANEEVRYTYGYITKHARIENGLEKDHNTDARCISGNPKARPTDVWLMKKTRCHNRQVHKMQIPKGGIKLPNQAPPVLYGFRLFDKVMLDNRIGFVYGRRTSGYFLVKDIKGNVLSNSVSYKKLKLIQKRRNFIVDKRDANL